MKNVVEIVGVVKNSNHNRRKLNITAAGILAAQREFEETQKLFRKLGFNV